MTEMRSCLDCGAVDAWKDAELEAHYHVGSRLFTKSVPGRACAKCGGGGLVTLQEMILLEWEAAQVLRREVDEGKEACAETLRFLEKMNKALDPRHIPPLVVKTRRAP